LFVIAGSFAGAKRAQDTAVAVGTAPRSVIRWMTLASISPPMTIRFGRVSGVFFAPVVTANVGVANLAKYRGRWRAIALDPEYAEL
jgi:hypothetical protein